MRLAKCCTPVPGDEIVGYISLGKGITIHRERLPERQGACAPARALHAGRPGTAARRRASASRSRSSRGTARGCSRTWRGRSPSTARTSSRTAARSRISWRRTGTSAEVGDVKELRGAADGAAQHRSRLRRVPRHAQLTSLVRGIIPRMSEVPRFRDSARRESDYNECKGRGHQAAAPDRFEDNGRARGLFEIRFAQVRRLGRSPDGRRAGDYDRCQARDVS